VFTVLPVDTDVKPILWWVVGVLKSSRSVTLEGMVETRIPSLRGEKRYYGMKHATQQAFVCAVMGVEIGAKHLFITSKVSRCGVVTDFYPSLLPLSLRPGKSYPIPIIPCTRPTGVVY